jgi:hypothetical protein
VFLEGVTQRGCAFEIAGNALGEAAIGHASADGAQTVSPI